MQKATIKGNAVIRSIQRTDADNVEFIHKLKMDMNLDANTIKKIHKRCADNCLLLDIVEENDLEGLRVLVEKLKVDINVVKKDATPLTTAARCGFIEIFKYLVAKGANLDLASKKTRMTAFHFAVEKNQIALVKYMVDEKIAGKLVFNPNAMNDEHHAPLLTASYFGFAAIIKELVRIEELELNALDKEGGNALLACADGLSRSNNKNLHYLTIAQCLMDAGINIHLKDKYNQNALSRFAQTTLLAVTMMINQCRKESKRLAEIQFEKNKKNINEKSTIDQDIIACEKEKSEYISTFTAESVKLFVNSLAHNHNSVLCYAVEKGDLEIFKYLVQNGADIHFQNKTGTFKGYTVLMHAIQLKKFHIAQALINGIEVIQNDKKVTYSVDISKTTSSGLNALVMILGEAVLLLENKKISNIVQLMPLIHRMVDKMDNLNQGVAPSIVGDSHKGRASALSFATRLGDKTLIDKMLKKGANIHWEVLKGCTVLKLVQASKNNKTLLGRNNMIAYACLIAHQLKQVCIKLSHPINEEAIKLLTEFLCSDEVAKRNIYFSTENRYKLQTNVAMLNDQDIIRILAELEKQLDADNEITTEMFIRILEEHCKDLNQKKTIHRDLNAKSEFTRLFLSFDAETRTASSFSKLKEFLAEQHKVGNIQPDTYQFYHKKMLDAYGALVQAEETFQNCFVPFEKSLRQSNVSDQKIIDENTLALKTLLETYRLQKETLFQLKRDIEAVIEEKHNPTKQRAKPGKMKKRSKLPQTQLNSGNASHTLSNKSESHKTTDKSMQLETEHQASNPALKVNAKDLMPKELTPAKTELDDLSDILDSSEHMLRELEARAQALEQVRLKTDDELRVLHSSFKQEMFQETTESKRDAEVVQSDAQEGDAQESAVLEMQKSQKKRTKHATRQSLQTQQSGSKGRAKHNAIEPMTLADHAPLEEILTVIDQMKELDAIIKFTASDINENPQVFTPEQYKIVSLNALWGGFVLLMEELKKSHTTALFPESVAEVLRDFVFHEDGELQLLFKKPENDIQELKSMCQKMVTYLEGLKKLKAGKQGTIDLAALVKEIKSALFVNLINYASKRTKEQRDTSSQMPSLEVCKTQIQRSVYELKHYQEICSTQTHCLDNPSAHKVIQVGVGRVLARMGTYVTYMKTLYNSHYKIMGLDKYKEYCSVGKKFRHGDDHASLEWRALVDSLIQEYIYAGFNSKALLDSLTNPNATNFTPLYQSKTPAGTKNGQSTQVSTLVATATTAFVATTTAVATDTTAVATDETTEVRPLSALLQNIANPSTSR